MEQSFEALGASSAEPADHPMYGAPAWPSLVEPSRLVPSASPRTADGESAKTNDWPLAGWVLPPPWARASFAATGTGWGTALRVRSPAEQAEAARHYEEFDTAADRLEQHIDRTVQAMGISPVATGGELEPPSSTDLPPGGTPEPQPQPGPPASQRLPGHGFSPGRAGMLLGPGASAFLPPSDDQRDQPYPARVDRDLWRPWPEADNLDRGTYLPLAKDVTTGRFYPAWPRAVTEALRSLGNVGAAMTNEPADMSTLDQDVLTTSMLGAGISPAARVSVATSRAALPSAKFGNATSNDYRTTSFTAYPKLRSQVSVHHAVEQQVLKLFPGVATESEIHSLENLRGIPNDLASLLHLNQIRREWNRFYAPFTASRTAPTKAQLLQKAAEIDAKFGSRFRPPAGGGK